MVGPSGSGETTLMRFYDPIEGVVRIDGEDLRKFKQTSVRRHIGVVLQDPLLFNDTLRNNIVYGKPNATPAQVEAAARAAHAHDFIMRLPQGYATPVGERGTLLSVGERRRITIVGTHQRSAHRDSRRGHGVARRGVGGTCAGSARSLARGADDVRHRASPDSR